MKKYISEIDFILSPTLTNDQLNTLFGTVWEGFIPRDFMPVLARSLLYVGAYVEGQLVGFVNVAWDGGHHAFLLDTTVHRGFQRQGIGKGLVLAAIAGVRERGLEWLHVDYEPHLAAFYAHCGFRPTQAGLVYLK